jgi:endonuclease YncB( thermonuclease family)
MKKSNSILLALALSLAAWAAVAETIEGRVIGVADGDTITLLLVSGTTKTPRKIRVSGIDAPEKAQAFGAVAKDAMSQLAFGSDATAECRTVDRYGRSICLVRVKGIDVGLRMIELGLAWHYKKYANTQPREESASYALLETASRAAKRGLWRDLDTDAPPVPPWDWRRAQKSQEQ